MPICALTVRKQKGTYDRFLAVLYRKVSVISEIFLQTNFTDKEITNMKITYLVNERQADSSLVLVETTSAHWHRIVAANKTAPANERRYFYADILSDNYNLDCIVMEVSKEQHAAKGDPLAATGMLPRLTLFYHWKNWWKVTAPRYLPLNVRKKPSSVPS